MTDMQPDDDLDDFDPTPYIVPNEEYHPNPYEDDDFDGKQDDFDDAEKVEGLGGEALPDAPLTVLEGRKRLRQLIESGSTVDWDSEEIKGYCLRVQRKAQLIPPLHTDAQQDYDQSPEKIPCTFETVKWDRLDTGDRLYFKSPASGSGHGHIVDNLKIPGRGPLCITTDVPSGKVGVCDPHWFRDNWGMELEGASKVVNGHRVHVTKDDEQGSGGNDTDAKWPGWETVAAALLNERRANIVTQGAIKALGVDWKLKDEMLIRSEARHAAVERDRRVAHEINQ